MFKKGNQINKGRASHNKGKILSVETRNKISNALKGRIPWNKGLTKETSLILLEQGKKHSIKIKGKPSWNKGKRLSETHKMNLSISHKGKRSNPDGEFKKGITPWNKGTKGICKSWNKGLKTGLVPKTAFKKGNHYSPETEFKTETTVGCKNVNWKNGISKEPYGRGWTNALKESIRLRDNYKCQICGILQEECNVALTVHHKDAVKTNLDPNNLISLCRKCHTTLHHKMLKMAKGVD